MYFNKKDSKQIFQESLNSVYYGKANGKVLDDPRRLKKDRISQMNSPPPLLPKVVNKVVENSSQARNDIHIKITNIMENSLTITHTHDTPGLYLKCQFNQSLIILHGILNIIHCI